MTKGGPEFKCEPCALVGMRERVSVHVWLGTGACRTTDSWDLTAEPQDLPGAKETRDRDSGAWESAQGRKAPSSPLRLEASPGLAGLGGWLQGRLWPHPPHV